MFNEESTTLSYVGVRLNKPVGEILEKVYYFQNTFCDPTQYVINIFTWV